jgi:hypothetical protein
MPVFPAVHGVRLFLPLRGLIFPMLLSAFMAEVVPTGNPIVSVFPSCPMGIPLAPAVSFPLVYFPPRVERGEVRKRLWIVLPLSAAILTILSVTPFLAAE